MRGKKKLMIEELKTQLGVVTHACKQVGISRMTHYKWLKDDPEYKLEVDHIDDIALDFAEGSLFRMMQEKNTAATIFFLKCRGKARGYIERPDNQINIANVSKTDNAIQIIIPEGVQEFLKAEQVAVPNGQ